MSNKSLFYMDDLKPGTAIVFDDKNLSEEMQEILKGATSSFKKPINYRTVSKDRKAMVCRIPERCIWWVAKVEGSGDDQVFNRMLTCWIDDSRSRTQRSSRTWQSEEGNRRASQRHPAGSPHLPGDVGDYREGTGPCVIPYSPAGSGSRRRRNRRNPEMFYSLIKAHAAPLLHAAGTALQQAAARISWPRLTISTQPPACSGN